MKQKITLQSLSEQIDTLKDYSMSNIRRLGALEDTLRKLEVNKAWRIWKNILAGIATIFIVVWLALALAYFLA